MLDFVMGAKTKPAAVDDLVDALRQIDDAEGIVYVGYPVVATESETTAIDALLTSGRIGVVIFDLLEEIPTSETWERIEEHQSRLVAALTSRLLLHAELRKGRALAFEIQVVTYSPMPITPPIGRELILASSTDLRRVLASMPPLPEGLIIHLNAALQSVTTIKPRKKRAAVRLRTSRGAILKEIEKNIANLDKWQRRAAIETPAGPQRIRGIAGSGKTVVLALKAAYLHAQHPEWNIGVTFHTRSLYQQFGDLIRRFYFDQQRDEPDWAKLRVLHSWGSREQPGVYSEIASSFGMPPLNFSTARGRYGIEKAFEGICAELLGAITKQPPTPIFDVLLIDEGQDLPAPFFRLCYHATKSPKRLVWAYDELQNLGSYSMAPPEELFGNGDNGRPLVELRNVQGMAHQDVILRVCYRNTPWALATAHALGFGVYRSEGLCQFFDDAALWRDIGYEFVAGSITPGERVALRRAPDSFPRFFGELLVPEDAVQSHVFPGPDAQIEWLVGAIKRNLSEDELEPDDIFVIFPNPLTVTKDAGPLIAALEKERLRAHIVGVTSSRDEVFAPDSIAISGIHRAKGNEAPMVYVANSEYCFGGLELIRKRNTVFTAITRSRAWVRICGCGPTMERLDEEIKAVAGLGYRLEFGVPTNEELEKMRKIHRDMTSDEKRVVGEATDALERLLGRVEAGELSLEHLPAAIRDRLKELLGPSGDE